jgi:hypothetical protein
VTLPWLTSETLCAVRLSASYLNTPGDIDNVGQAVGYPEWWLEAVGFGRFPEPSPSACAAPAARGGGGGAAPAAGLEAQLAALRAQVQRLGEEPVA